MKYTPEPGDRINSYALVSYIPGPLGWFLDEMRRQLVPSSVAQSHVTVLPPRPLFISDSDAKSELERELRYIPPFTVELGDIEVFESTSVIYVSLASGMREFKELHERLSGGGFKFQECFSYHPHITLAQDFPPPELPDMVAIARESWARFRHPKRFRVEQLTFVQNTLENGWLDLADFSLHDPVMAGMR